MKSVLRTLPFVFFAILAAPSRQARAADASPPTRPNIVFILTDDQRVGFMGFEGHPVSKTPNLDRLAKEGVWFRNFFVTTPLCSPSRASFLSGLYAHKHCVINNDKLGIDVLGHRLLSWPRQLREAGYETAFLGKFHIGFDDSRHLGFDRWLSFKGLGCYIDSVVNDDGLQRQLTGHMTDYLNEQAVEFITRRHDKPFALLLAHKAVHYPYLPAARHQNLYADYHFHLPTLPKSDLAGKPVLTTPVPAASFIDTEDIGPEPGESRHGRGHDPASIVSDQLRCLADIDEGLGQIFAALEKTGQLERTIIVYTSDNGYLLGEHGRFDDKRWPWEPSIRVPLLIRYPALVAPGSTRDQLVLNIDMAPTLLDLAGVKPLERMQGQSFVPVLASADAPWRKEFLAEYYLEKIVPSVPTWQCVRGERFKYIHYVGKPDDFDEFYDLQADPQEVKNLVNDSASQTPLWEMHRKLSELLRQTR
jgi:N-acetylglucosamine-6-sulfatase